MRSSRCAAVGVVAELMDVHAAFGIGIIAGDVVGDSRGRRLVRLFECDGPGDLTVSSKYGN